MGSPFSGRGRNFMIAPSIVMKSLAEPDTRSFGMRSPFGSCVVLGPHLLANEGFPWYLV